MRLLSNNNRVSGRLEIESADLGQIINNVVGSLDLDQNGTIVIAGNVVSGTAKYGNEWLVWHWKQPDLGLDDWDLYGNVEVDVANTGSDTCQVPPSST